MNVISFGLWGANPKYTAGAIENAKLAPTIYPDWLVYMWVDRSTVPSTVLSTLTSLGVTIQPYDPAITAHLFQRMLVHDCPEVARYIVRDCDSRLSIRERQCVDAWITAGTVLHTIHDHPYHLAGPPIMGGLYGFWKLGDTRRFSMRNMILDSSVAKENRWGSDQTFLDEELWPRYHLNCTQHGKSTPIPPSPGDPESFCGEVIDARGLPNLEHRAIRKRGKL